MAKKDSLKKYKDKRDFRSSPEPAGRRTAKNHKRPIFVIQKHDARNLHYDFRLEVDGVLKSWAVPKGPSTDPRVKRGAFAVEDHPVDYAKFEGVIPEGEYGAGPVMVWDRGTYRNLSKKDDKKVSMGQALEKGHASFWLNGKKLKGGYSLTRIAKGKKERWLLVKMKDDEADARRKPVKSEPDSVLSGRSLKEIEKEESE
jgi:DNA ligase D-like protein (predicted 3'-phosphoesterase)